MTRRRAPLAFLGKLRADDWRRAFILAEILMPPLADRSLPAAVDPARLAGRSQRAEEMS